MTPGAIQPGRRARIFAVGIDFILNLYAGG